MAHSISAAPLLFLSLLVSTCYGVDPQCVTNFTLSSNVSSNSNFTLNVSPDTLLPNTTYNVSVNGTGNSFNVTLQAVSVSVSVSTPVGNWSLCTQSLQFINFNLTNSSIQTNWTSPAPANLTGVTNVTIRAYIDNNNQTYLISKLLSPAVNATSAPATQTATTIKQTTSGGSSYHSNLISTAGIQILFLFMISKYLS